MDYTISEVAERMNLTAYTLRYYDKEGLFPLMERSSGGSRIFRDEDFEWLGLIQCLKASGMPIKDIKTFIDWNMEGDGTIAQRCEMFRERREAVQSQIKELQKMLETIEYKCWYYETALEAGTVDVHKKNDPKLCPIKPKPYGFRAS